MCGIAGIAFADGVMPDAADRVRRMIELQNHRGPDGRGFYDGENVSLGHARLAIIDLSEAGHQPMTDADERYWLTFNGEIYNYLDLASELRNLGHTFRGHCDAEVLLAAFVQWGTDCLSRLRGMFAFAIWDKETKTLFAARDRLGIKPFHYWTDGKTKFAFASEIKALLDFLSQRNVNRKLAEDFLAWNLVDHEATETMIESINRLAPAHALQWRIGEEIKIWSYWNYQVNDELFTSQQQRLIYEEEFRNEFIKTVRLHLQADVHVGSCLSGGLDSSAIVCVINKELRKQNIWREDWQHVFTACFDDPAIDEREYMNEVVRVTNAKSHTVYPTGAKFREEMEEWIWFQEEPVAGTGPYAHYCVARLARENGVKVLLDGQGADEQLAGYRKFILVYLRQLVANGHYTKAVSEAAKFFISPEILRTSDFSYGRRYLFKKLDEVERIWNGNDVPSKPASLGIEPSLARRTEADVLKYSLPLLLRYEDRNTMAFSIEARVPFVDHVLVELMAKLPADMRLSNGWTKRIMRDALKNILPDKVRLRKSKLGFSTPLTRWVNNELRGWMEEMLEEPRYLSDIVDAKEARKLLKDYYEGITPKTTMNLLFRCALFEAWARVYIEGNGFSGSTDNRKIYSVVGQSAS